MRIEPAPSDPWCSGPKPAAAAAAAPPLDPPAVRPCRHGLWQAPFSVLPESPFQPRSGVVVFPSSAPARRRAATGASAAGAGSRNSGEPCPVGMPSASSRSFSVYGTPASGGASPAACAASARRASASARSGVSVTKALIGPSRWSMRASVASTTSTGDSALEAYASSRSQAVSAVRSETSGVIAHLGVTPWLDCRAAVLLRSNVGDRFGERPVMAGEILGAVLPLAVHVVGGFVEDGRAGGTGTCAVRARILDANHDRDGGRLPGGRRTPVRGRLGDDERPGADAHLRAMARADPHMLDRPERRYEPAHRGPHIGIAEHRNDGVRWDRAVG